MAKVIKASELITGDEILLSIGAMNRRQCVVLSPQGKDCRGRLNLLVSIHQHNGDWLDDVVTMWPDTTVVLMKRD